MIRDGISSFGSRCLFLVKGFRRRVLVRPGESMAADFVIDLRNGKPFQFRVASGGDPSRPES
jgi:hypothetical protein